MQHLDDTQLVDAVDGRLDAATAAHAEACDTCGARVTEMREALRGLAAVDVPEPSPLFWDHFPSRVSRAIDAAAAPQRWFTPARLVWGSAAALIVVLLLLLPSRVMSPAGEGRQENAGDSTSTMLNDLEPWPTSDDLDADEAWALMRIVAEDIDYEDARQIGVAPRAGSIERAAMELSDGERAELARLIEQELKRSGV
ncbi:MAG: hypothetical protein WD227_09470 [Vicinamibacterales bacterium]